MNIFAKINRKTLVQNKMRTIVTIMGVLLSVSMITAITSLLSSVLVYGRDLIKVEEGSWHGKLENISDAQKNIIVGDKEVANTFALYDLGYSVLEDSVNKYKPYVHLASMEGDTDLVGFYLTSGRMPENATEVIVPDHLFENGGVSLKLNQDYTFDFGVRTWEGETIVQNEGLLANETITDTKSRSFKVVGFYKRGNFERFDAAGYTLLTTASEEDKEKVVLLYFDVHVPRHYIETKETLERNLRLEDDGPRSVIFSHSTLLGLEGVTQYGTFKATIISLSTIFLLMIIFASVSLIYNAFAISVAERKRQFGLLSSIGASQKQLRKMVLNEAMTVAGIGIPLGLISGLIGISITLHFLRPHFDRISGFEVEKLPELRLVVTPSAIIIAIVLALITVLISAWLPAIRASRSSAIDAIRQAKDIKMKQVKTSKLHYKLFGLSSSLAAKYYKRSKKSYRATIFSLAISIVLFLSAVGFTTSIQQSVSMFVEENDSDIHVRARFEKEADLQELKALTSDLASLEHMNEFGINLILEGDFYNLISTPSFDPKTKELMHVKLDDKLQYISGFGITFVKDEFFDEAAKAFGLSSTNAIRKINNKIELTPLILNKHVMPNAKTKKYEELRIFKSPAKGVMEWNALEARENMDYAYINLEQGEQDIDEAKVEVLYSGHFDKPEEEYIEETVPLIEVKKEIATIKIENLIDEPVKYSNVNYANIFYLPLSSLESILESLKANDALYNPLLLIGATGHDNKALYDEMRGVLLESDYNIIYITNVAEENQMSMSIVTIIKVFSYGFIALISLIGLANVFNTITTNVQLRRRDFASLESIGLSPKDQRKMLLFESNLYATRAMILGLPLGLAFNYAIHRALRESFESQYYFPLFECILVSIVIALVVLISMSYAMKQVKKVSVVETIRREAI